MWPSISCTPPSTRASSTTEPRRRKTAEPRGARRLTAGHRGHDAAKTRSLVGQGQARSTSALTRPGAGLRVAPPFPSLPPFRTRRTTPTSRLEAELAEGGRRAERDHDAPTGAPAPRTARAWATTGRGPTRPRCARAPGWPTRPAGPLSICRRPRARARAWRASGVALSKGQREPGHASPTRLRGAAPSRSQAGGQRARPARRSKKAVASAREGVRTTLSRAKAAASGQVLAAMRWAAAPRS